MFVICHAEHAIWFLQSCLLYNPVQQYILVYNDSMPVHILLVRLLASSCSSTYWVADTFCKPATSHPVPTRGVELDRLFFGHHALNSWGSMEGVTLEH